MDSKFSASMKKFSEKIFSFFEKPVFQYVMTFLYSPIGWWALWKCGKQPIWLKAILTIVSLPFAFFNVFYLSWIGIPIMLFLYFSSRSVQTMIKVAAGGLSILPILISGMLFFNTPSSSPEKNLQVADISSVFSEISSNPTSSKAEEVSSIAISSIEAEPAPVAEPSQMPSVEPAPVPSAEPSSQIPPSSVAPPPAPSSAPAPSVAPTPPAVSSVAPAPPASTAQAQAYTAPTTPAPAQGNNNFDTYSDTQATSAYVGNKNSYIFHRAGCSSVNKMKPANKVDFSTRDQAINAGYTPCERCNP